MGHHYNGKNPLLWYRRRKPQINTCVTSVSILLEIAIGNNTHTKLGLRSGGIELLSLELGSEQGSKAEFTVFLIFKREVQCPKMKVQPFSSQCWPVSKYIRKKEDNFICDVIKTILCAVDTQIRCYSAITKPVCVTLSQERHGTSDWICLWGCLPLKLQQ